MLSGKFGAEERPWHGELPGPPSLYPIVQMKKLRPRTGEGLLRSSSEFVGKAELKHSCL